MWLLVQSLTVRLPEAGQKPRLYANPSRDDLRIVFLQSLRAASVSIDLVMFGLNDPAILSVLSQKIQQRIPTRISYDPEGSPALTEILRGGEVFPIYQKGLMHQKILIIDGKMVFLGSANFTSPSLKMHDNLVVGFVSEEVAQFLREKAPLTSGYLQSRVGGQKVEIWLLPDIQGQALAMMRNALRGAQKSLRVAQFTLTHEHLLDELIQAKQRGVDVTVLVDMHSARGASKKAVAKLQGAHVSVLLSQGVQLLHHKFAYIDEKTLLMGSANWTKSALSKNSDCLIMLHDLDIEQQRFMQRLWKRLKTTAKAPN